MMHAYQPSILRSSFVASVRRTRQLSRYCVPYLFYKPSPGPWSQAVRGEVRSAHPPGLKSRLMIAVTMVSERSLAEGPRQPKASRTNSAFDKRRIGIGGDRDWRSGALPLDRRRLNASVNGLHGAGFEEGERMAPSHDQRPAPPVL